MHHFDAISQKISGGGPPDPHLREGVTPSPTLPLSALRASVKPSASLVTWAPPAVEVLDPPLAAELDYAKTNHEIIRDIHLANILF